MRLVLAALAAFSLWTATAAAACEGRDMRPDFSDAERALLDEATASTPFGEGNHWIAERDGEVIHLVGTIHISDPRLAAPAEGLRETIDGAGLLLLEMTPGGMEDLERRMREDPGMLVLKDTALPELMEEAEWQRLADAAKARGIPPVMAAKFQPWYLSMVLALPGCATESPSVLDGLDARLQRIAKDTGTQMQALEDVDTVFRLFQDAPMEDQLEMLRAAIVPGDDGSDMMATLIATYFEERTAASWELSRLMSRRSSPLPPEEVDESFDQMEATLLTARNEAWLPVILDAVEETAQPVVVAAGAAHLQGETGLAALLEAEGFTLARAPFATPE